MTPIAVKDSWPRLGRLVDKLTSCDDITVIGKFREYLLSYSLSRVQLQVFFFAVGFYKTVYPIQKWCGVIKVKWDAQVRKQSLEETYLIVTSVYTSMLYYRSHLKKLCSQVLDLDSHPYSVLGLRNSDTPATIDGAKKALACPTPSFFILLKVDLPPPFYCPHTSSRIHESLTGGIKSTPA